MIWEIEYDKHGFLLSYMNRDKQLIKCVGGQFLPTKVVMRCLEYTRRKNT